MIMEQIEVTKNGSLNSFPLAELLRLANMESLSGAFRLSHERVKAVVYCQEGAVVYATSNVRSHRLMECVRRWNLFTQEQLNSIGELPTDYELCESLVANNLIKRENLSDLFVRQSQEVLHAILLWQEGDWEFDSRVRLADTMHFNVPVSALFLEASRRFSPEFASNRFANSQEKFSLVTDFTENVQFQPVEAFLLSRLYTPLELKDLLAISGLPESAALHALYSLTVCGIIKRESYPSPFSDSDINQLRADSTPTKRTEVKPSVTPKPPASTPKPEPQPETVANAPEPVVDEKAELEKFLVRVENAKDYYEIIGVDKNAEDEAIKRAYHNQVKRFHPDRFHSETGTPLHSRLQMAFAKLAQSYDVLRDSKLKKVYDHKLSSGAIQSAGSAGDKKQMAEEKFQQGMAALQQNNVNAALPLFGQAVRLIPNEARYRAQYGLALSKNLNMRKQAENEFQEAIKLDNKNVSYRVILAEFYRDMKLFKRAESEAQRALTMEPGHKEAQRLLDSLKNK